MTTEEKRLLLADLCMRSPYGIKVNINSSIEEQNRMELFDVNLESETIGVGNDRWAFRAVPVEDEDGRIVRPYLRPMSSMTAQEWCELCDCDAEDEMAAIYINGRRFVSHVNRENFLNSHRFDHHGLIPMGLAIEAPEDMYKTE